MACCEKLGKEGFRGIFINFKNKPIWFKNIDNLQEIPILKYNDFILKDSISIVKYIDMKYKDKGI